MTRCAHLSLILLVAGAAACSALPGENDSQANERPPRAGFELTPVEVVFTHGEARLSGTLFVPETATQRPALVLLGGSDRGARGPLKTRLARAVAESGVAALIYDSPGTGQSTGNALFQARRDRAHEALAAARYLMSRDDIDARRVGLLGGSEGAVVALLAAAMDQEIAFAIAVSGAFGISMMEQSRFRIEAMGLRRGIGDDEIDRALVLEELLYALMSGHDVVEWRLLRTRTNRWGGEPWEELIELLERVQGGLSDPEKDAVWSSLKRILRGWMPAPWFDLAVVDRRNLERVLAMDTGMFFGLLERGPLAGGAWFPSWGELELLAGIRCPVLAVWGEEDDYLPVHRSSAWLEANLRQAGNDDVTLRIFPGATHSLTALDSGNFVAGYPQIMLDWLRERVGGER